MNKPTIVLLFLILYTNVYSQSLKGTSWINYLHLQHVDTIEFFSSSMSDSIYKEVNDDFHYGWNFYNDGVVDIIKEHYIIGTKVELDTLKKIYNFFQPPLENIKVDFIGYISNPPKFSLHTWDHKKANFEQLDNYIIISFNGEEQHYQIIKLQNNYLKVKMINRITK